VRDFTDYGSRQFPEGWPQKGAKDTRKIIKNFLTLVIYVHFVAILISTKNGLAAKRRKRHKKIIK
jgi:hypothetical protein